MTATPVGVLDWGVGGFGVVALLRACCPRLPIRYLADSGSRPYGTLSEDALAARVTWAVRTLDVSRVVVACNAASTVLAAVRDVVDADVVGIIDAGIAAALRSGADRVGVIGGHRTMNSQAYQRALQAAGRAVIAVPAQPLSAHVEAGRLSGDAVVSDVEAVLRPIVAGGAQALVLACTHYPALAPLFGALAPGLPLIDPATEAVAAITARWQLPEGGGDSGPAAPDVWTTGDAQQTRRGARAAFAVTIAAPIRSVGR